jgi:hypothetical protein
MWIIFRSLALVALAELSLYAQLNVGGITGTVHDPSGAVMPAVTVVATNTGTTLTQQAVTNNEGVYTFKLLPIGYYKVSVTQTGFQRFERTDIQVVSGESLTVDITLAVGQVTQTVTVTGAAALLDTQTSNAGTSRTSQELAPLPLPLFGNSSRTAMAAARTMAGVAYDPGESGGQEFMVVSRSQINGQAPGIWGYKVDGLEGSYGDKETASDFITPVPDVVQEVRLTSNTDAVDGFSGGVNYSVSLKSGTSKLHGDIYNYIRNDLTEARNTLLAKVPEDKQDNGGFVIGGPIVIPHVYDGRDKTFFMVNMDFYRWRTTIAGAQAAVVGSVPTVLQRQGNFTELLGPQVGTDALGRPVFQGEIYDPTTTRPDGKGGFIRDPYTYNGQLNVINPAQISPVSMNYLAKIALPTTSGTANNWVGPSNQFRVNKDQLYMKFDEIINARHRFSFSWERLMPWFISDKGTKTGFVGHSFTSTGVGYLDPAINTGFNDDRDEYRLRFNYVWTVRPNLLFNFRAGLTATPNRVQFRFPLTGPSLTFGRDAGIRGTLDPSSPNVSVNGLSSFGNGSAYYGNAFQQIPATADFSWSRGTHNLKFGVDEVYDIFFNTAGRASYGNFSFQPRITGMPGFATTGQGVAAFVTGWLDTATVQTPIITHTHMSGWGFFAQDSWRATPKLTLNYGLRWNIFPPGAESNDRAGTFDPTLINPVTGTKGAISFYGTGAGRNGLHQLQPIYYGAVNPQFGFAYSLNPKTVVRGFYGLSNGPYWTKFIGSNAPGYPTDGFGLSLTAGGLDNGITPAYNWNNPFPLSFPSSFPVINPAISNGQATTLWSRFDNRPQRIQNVSFEVSRELPGQIAFKATYIGTFAHGLVLADPYDLNAPPLSALSLGNLLTQNINSPAARAAGIPIPYPGFNSSVVQALRPYPQYQRIVCGNCQVGYSSYNSAQFNFQKRFGSGLTFLANYTISKEIASEAGIWGGGSARHPTLWASDSHQLLQGQERPQILRFSWVYDLPVGRGKRFLTNTSKPLDKILGGWQVAGVQNYNSGRPVAIGTTTTNGVTSGTWPVLNPGVPIVANKCSSALQSVPYLNIKAFSDPAPFTIGNYRYLEQVRPCAYLNEDLELSKTILIHESLNFQIGTMWTNAFNRTEWHNGQLGLNIDVPAAFGRYTGAYPARNIQFYTRLQW